MVIIIKYVVLISENIESGTKVKITNDKKYKIITILTIILIITPKNTE